MKRLAPSIFPISTMTVIIRDDSPMINCGDSPSYRTVRVELTPEQIAKIELFATGGNGNAYWHEAISRVVLEVPITGGE